MTQNTDVSWNSCCLLEAEDDDESLKHHWDYIYEPDAKELLDGLLTRYVESQVYQAVLKTAPASRPRGWLR